MNWVKSVLVVSLWILFILGCASTSMTSFRDPLYREKAFSNLVVYANVHDLYWRTAIESRIVTELLERGVRARGSMNLLPPTRRLSQAIVDSTLAAHEIDGFLLVIIGDTGAEEVYIPSTGSTSVTEGERTPTGYKETTRTTVNPGTTATKQWARMETQLYDAASGSMAWIATSVSAGNAYANMDNVVNSYCGRVVTRLMREGVVEGDKRGLLGLLETSVLQAPYTIVLEGGVLVGAEAISTRSDMLRVRGADARESFIPLYKVKRVTDRSGRDFTRWVVSEGKSLP